MSDIIYVNKFYFCIEHGYELCNKCFTDLRVVNNMRQGVADGIEAKLGRNFNLENRKPLNAFASGAVSCGSTGRLKDRYKCSHHEVLDCSTCFDWVNLIVALEKKDRGHVDDRDLLVRLLRSMDVEYPPAYKPPVEDLERKLRQALDYAQDVKSLGTFPLNPDSLPLWKISHPDKSIRDGMNRISFEEGVKLAAARSSGQKPVEFELNRSGFMDLGHTLLNLARGLQDGSKRWILQDDNHGEAICIRVFDVYEAAVDTPLVSFMFEIGSESAPIQSTFHFVDNMVKEGSIKQICCSREEQALLRKLLFLNSSRISPDCKPARRWFENTFKLSFLAPVGPIGLEGIGRLVRDGGCEICGQKTVSRCSQCHIAAYCGSECQMAHWKTHKPLCRSFKGATWDTFKFTTSPMMSDAEGIEV